MLANCKRAQNLPHQRTTFTAPHLYFVDKLPEPTLRVHGGSRQLSRVKSPLVQVAVVQRVSRDEALGRDTKGQVNVKAGLRQGSEKKASGHVKPVRLTKQQICSTFGWGTGSTNRHDHSSCYFRAFYFLALFRQLERCTCREEHDLLPASPYTALSR